MKIKYRQMIMIFVIVAMMFFTINLFFPQWGPIVTLVGMVSIFIVFKIYQWTKGADEEKEDLE